jgi:hypothetical protein
VRRLDRHLGRIALKFGTRDCNSQDRHCTW